jgi:predicted transcriptional regulator
MSIRTLVEFNHDYAHRIEEDGLQFLTLLEAVLRGHDKEATEELQHRFGVTVGRARHHSTPMKGELLAAFGGREP